LWRESTTAGKRLCRIFLFQLIPWSQPEQLRELYCIAVAATHDTGIFCGASVSAAFPSREKIDRAALIELDGHVKV